jgi:hypothetical protein
LDTSFDWSALSGGRACDDSVWLDDPHIPLGRDCAAKLALGAHEAQMVVNSLSIGQFHDVVCHSYLQQNRNISISASATVNLGAVFCSSSSQFLEDFVEIASSPNAVGHIRPDFPYSWYNRDLVKPCGEVMENGWTRYLVHSL